MRVLNAAELFYLSANISRPVNELAQALMTTEEHVKVLLAQQPATPVKKRGRPKKVAVVEQSNVAALPPTLPILEAMARVPERGAIAMSQAASEIGDGIKPAAPKLPDGVFKFKP